MQHFLCVYVSSRRIALYYNSDDGASTLNTFRPESATPTNGVVPFATLIQNDSVSTGTNFAYNESLKNAPNAFFDLFSLDGSDFDENKLRMNADEIPSIALKAYLANAVSEVYSVEIDLVKSDLPVMLAFTNDVESVKRNIMIDWFKRDGFGNLSMIDFESELLSNIQLNTDFACTVVSDGRDVTSSLYIRKSKDLLATKTMAGVGTDPRMKIGSEMLWNSLNNTGYLSFEHELPILQKYVSDFIASGKPLLEREIELSDEKMHAAYLEKSEIERRANSENGLAPHFRSFLSDESVKSTEVSLVLCESSESASLLANTFLNEYSEVFSVTERQWLNVYTSIWRTAKKAEYKMKSIVSRKPANAAAIRRWVTEKNEFVDVLLRVQEESSFATDNISRATSEQMRVENEWKNRIKLGDFIGARALVDSASTTDVKSQISSLNKAFNTLNEYAQFVEEVNDVDDANEQIEKFSRLYSGIKELKVKAENIENFRGDLLSQTDKIQDNLSLFNEKIEELRKTSVKATQDRLVAELKKMMPEWYPLPIIQTSKVSVKITAEITSTGFLFMKKKKLHVKVDFGDATIPYRCVLAFFTDTVSRVDRDKAFVEDLNDKGESLSGVIEKEYNLPLPEMPSCGKKGTLTIKLWPHESETVGINSAFDGNTCFCEQ